MPFPAGNPSVNLLASAQKPILHLREAMEELHFNITVSLLSMGPGLLYAENGTAAGRVEMQATENVWVYEPLLLVSVYAVAAVVDVLVMCVGLWAVVKNGGTSGFEFARVVATTRGLDREVVKEWEDGLDPVPEKVEKRRVRYGLIEDRGRRRFGFRLVG